MSAARAAVGGAESATAMQERRFIGIPEMKKDGGYAVLSSGGGSSLLRRG